jgi:hypothetical protein
MASRGVTPLPRGKPSGLPFNAKFVNVAAPAGLHSPTIYGDDHRAAGNLRSSLWRLRGAGIDVLTSDKSSLCLRDGVLVDAPCSGVGTWQRNPQAKWTSSLKDVAELAAVQIKLLESVSASVKPGGKLIYSVCTLTSPETTDVIRDFEKRFPEFRAVSVVNPFDPDGIADAMHLALTMPPEERKERHSALREKVFRTTAQVFARRFIEALTPRAVARAADGRGPATSLTPPAPLPGLDAFPTATVEKRENPAGLGRDSGGTPAACPRRKYANSTRSSMYSLSRVRQIGFVSS